MDVDVHLFTCCLIRLILSCEVHLTFTAQYLGYDIYIYFFVLCFCIYTYFFCKKTVAINVFIRLFSYVCDNRLTYSCGSDV